MKFPTVSSWIIFLLLWQSVPSLAQKPLSFSRDSVKESFDGKWLIVRYGKPAVNGRKIFGGVVPYYKVWRTGAGAATELETTVDLEMNGAIVPRGKYTLYTLPTENSWKFIINKQTGQWGTVYNSQLDLARIDVAPQRTPRPVEELTFRIEKRTATEGILSLAWENVQLSLPFHVSHEPLLPSPKDSTIQKIGHVTLAVHYSRPSVRGRKIFGGVVPYGQVWRTGANAATTLILSGDAWFGGVKIPKGTYTLYTLPMKKRWLLIINKQTGQWGTVYNKVLDLVRLPLKIQTLPQLVEKFSIRIERRGISDGLLLLEWEHTQASIKIEVK